MKNAATRVRHMRVPVCRSDVNRLTPEGGREPLNRDNSSSSVALFQRVMPFEFAAITACSE